MILDARRRYARSHAKMRAEERYGIELNHETHRELRDLIMGKTKSGDAVLGCLQKTLRGRRLYRVFWRGKVFQLVWDRPRRTVVTLLPQDETDLAEEAKRKDVAVQSTQSPA